VRFSTSRAKLLLFEPLSDLPEIEEEKVFYHYSSSISMHARFPGCTRLCILFLTAVKMEPPELSGTLRVVKDLCNI